MNKNNPKKVIKGLLFVIAFSFGCNVYITVKYNIGHQKYLLATDVIDMQDKYIRKLVKQCGQ